MRRRRGLHRVKKEAKKVKGLFLEPEIDLIFFDNDQVVLESVSIGVPLDDELFDEWGNGQ